jgi:hypothetical protein
MLKMIKIKKKNMEGEEEEVKKKKIDMGGSL